MHGHRARQSQHDGESYELDESGIVVVGRIGTGAMASVLRATMPDGRPTAVKLLMPRHMANPEVAERFVLEGELMRAVRSPHVPEIYATGSTESGQPYYAMELLDGVDLERLLEQTGGRVSVEDAIRYALDACEAVRAVHGAGILHRDVKPSNLFLAKRGDALPIVALLDFGIAKHLAGKGSRTTTAGLVVGTPSYMSPEQIRGTADIDARSDVWALGAVLFELLTGRSPFERDHAADTLHAVLESPVPALRPAWGVAPVGLEAVVRRCLEKRPEARFSTVAELSTELAPFLGRARRVSGIARRRPIHEASTVLEEREDDPQDEGS